MSSSDMFGGGAAPRVRLGFYNEVYLRNPQKKFGRMKRFLMVRHILVVMALAAINSATAFSFVNGDIYTTYNSNVSASNNTTIGHFSPTGTFLDSIALPSAYAPLKGLAFGPDGRLYVVAPSGTGFDVFALHSTGVVQSTFTAPGNVTANLSLGKIRFGANGDFYVTTAFNVVKFSIGTSAGTVVYEALATLFDTALLPSGNLLVLSQDSLKEVAPDGTVVRTITTSVNLYDARGMAYDAVTGDIFVSMLGDSNGFFRILRINGATGVVSHQATFVYADDLYITNDRRLVVGSRTQAPKLFDLNLVAVGSLQGDPQHFVTQMPFGIPAVAVAPCSLDLDGNSRIEPLADGLMLLRAMLGFSGNAVTNGALGSDARRTTWPEIRDFLNKSCGAKFVP